MSLLTAQANKKELTKLAQKVFTPVAKSVANLRLIELSHSFHNLANPQQDIHILKGVNLEIKLGYSMALSGPSGCGKSTLLQIIAGNLRPNSGEIWWGEQRIDLFSDDERARWRLKNLGLVFQDFRLFPHLTALENVALPLELLGETSRTAFEQAQDLLEQLQLTSRANHRPEMLSGGERQRVAIARALVTRPALLIADEPTGNLDYETAQQVEELLLAQVALRQVGLVYVTHNLQFADKAQEHWGLYQQQLINRQQQGQVNVDP